MENEQTLTINDPRGGHDVNTLNKREDVRSLLAKVLIFGYLGLASLLVISGVFFAPIDTVKELAIAVFGPLTGVSGSVLGFYFSEAGSSESSSSHSS